MFMVCTLPMLLWHYMGMKEWIKNKKVYITLLACGVVIVGICSVVLLIGVKKSAETDTSSVVFIHNSTTLPGWWAGDNYSPRDERPDDTNLATAQMTAAQGSKDVPGACFATFSYFDGEVDVTNEIEKIKSSLVGGDTPLEKVGEYRRAMSTFEGVKDYTLYQYRVVDASKLKSVEGVELGYVPLSNGYVEMRGYCEHTAQLSDTLPVFTVDGINIKDKAQDKA